MSIIERAVESGTPVRRNQVASASTTRKSAQPGPFEQVEFNRLATVNLLRGHEQDSRTIDQVRRIKRPVLQNAFGELAQPGSNIVMITSPSPAAGKTFTAVNLAQALSYDRDRSVLLIDADNTKGSLTKALGLAGEPGFFDALDNPAYSVESMVRDTELPGLTVIPTGRRFRESEEILASRHATEKLVQLGRKNPHRIILLDAPPVLPSPDAMALAAIAGQILMVVAAGMTDQESLKRSMELLDTGKPLGVVLNRAPITSWLPDYRGDSYADYAG